ncbi:MAG: phenylalanine--tRNA ligase subunit alpha [Oscillospiraceae bacterium]|nr:phenylalanine--tRNA ligase subunit alpha [Oscillospiraceae bacterium]
MEKRISELRQEIADALSKAKDTAILSGIHSRYLSKKGEISSLMQGLGKLSKEERPAAGQLINQFRDWAEATLKEKEGALKEAELAARYKKEAIDVTLPGTLRPTGSLHPISLVRAELTQAFMGLGFSVVESPEVELEHYCFTALNVPPGHPSRDRQDTFYMGETDEVLLRPHTSPGQIRTMEKQKPPLKVVVPGRVFRSDDDTSHTPMFHQMEGLVVDKNLNLCDLHGLLDVLAKAMFDEHVHIRFRPSFFPFTEPSVEVDVSCFVCDGKGCGLCKSTGWIEILGAGVVHRKVLAGCGIDPDEYSGLAFGVGLERVAMLKYGIGNIQILYDNDLRMLGQFHS